MRKKRGSGADTRAKGRIVEQIAAWMHWSPDVTVATNVRLPSRTGERKREIDVLISRQIAGYPIYIVIECKNEEKAIGVGKIDEFVGKLQDIHIPVQHGIYVSASGYTQGAVERADAVGIRPLRLKGLTPQKLAEAVMAALEATIYLCLQVVHFPRIDIPCTPLNHLGMFCDLSGFPVGTFLDILVDEWNQGNIPQIIGPHEIRIAIPPHWYHLQGSRLIHTSSLLIQVYVQGLVTTRSGQVNEYQLINDKSGVVEKSQVHLDFGEEPETEVLKSILKKEQLEDILQQSGAPAILQHRYRLPRILLKELFLWPPSERIIEILLENLQANQQGKPSPHDLHWIEFTDQNMARAFDPIWMGPTSEAEHKRFVPLVTQWEDEIRQAIRQQLSI